MKSKVIGFPQKGKRGKDSIERDIDFEAGVTFQIFLDKEDYVGLVQYCKERALKNPDDPYAQFYLGHAYVLNSQYQKAIEFMQLHHKKYPRNWDYHFVILDALFALGKTEDDFDWVERPIILKMSSKIIDKCYEFMKRKRKPRSIMELYGMFVLEGYLLFSEKDLLNALLKDGRFEIDEPDSEFWAEVSVVREKKK